MRVLGLDVGSRTIGVAVTDELGVCAHAVTTLQRRGTAADVAQVAALAKKYETDQLVAGMPYDEDGQEGPRAQRVRVLIEALQASALHVDVCDERYSTIEAEEMLREASVSKQKRKEVIDQLAAQVILQRWLDARTPTAP